MKIGIIGKGNVGTALGSGLQREGHQVRYGHRDPSEPVQEAAHFGDVIILAVPFSGVKDAAQTIGNAADGKVLIDVTNALDKNMGLAIGLTTSGAEELQKLLPRSKVVKAFNTVFAQNQSTGKVGNTVLTAFIAGDDAKAKATVMDLAHDLGFDSLDVGPLKCARYLEPMAVLLIGLGYGLHMGTDMGFKLVRG
ncbi:MAG: NADPH-dependent F420 reductase [Methanomicrobiales archaeon]|nr:NADPH-dependent F420 reductase [Methanomicrobiales archaeon]